MKSFLAFEHQFKSENWQCPNSGKLPQRIGGYPAFSPELTKSNDGYDATILDVLPPHAQTMCL
jgi:hypothetical protein